jgi:hypothetical protein
MLENPFLPTAEPSQNTLPADPTHVLFPLIYYSDKSNAARFAQFSLHPMLLRCANLPKHLATQNSCYEGNNLFFIYPKVCSILSSVLKDSFHFMWVYLDYMSCGRRKQQKVAYHRQTNRTHSLQTRLRHLVRGIKARKDDALWRWRGPDDLPADPHHHPGSRGTVSRAFLRVQS